MAGWQPAEIFPPIVDRNGYRVTVRDLEFLELGPEQVEAWRKRDAPLGIAVPLFRSLVQGLRVALNLDGIENCDVRLQGSSARFFSSWRKKMIYKREDFLDAFLEGRKRYPDPTELDEIQRRVNEHWPMPPRRPECRMFDSYYQLGLTRIRSDLDFQLSSDEIDQRVRRLVADLDVEPTDDRIFDSQYGFIKKEYIFETCGGVERWRARWEDIVERSITVAVFPQSGPVNESVFNDTSDWRVIEVADG